MAEPQRNWSSIENEATVASYLRMLKLELAGEPYSKSKENELLRPRLSGRTKAAVEYKYQNISAVLLENGWKYVNGYKPAVNVQHELRKEVERRLREDRELDQLMQQHVALDTSGNTLASTGMVETDPPDALLGSPEWNPRGIKRDYVYRDTQNRLLGFQGELAVLELERRRLIEHGRKDLAECVEHVAVSVGDGLGYDVASFNDDGSKRLIEVKTTVYARETPFFISSAEVDASSHYDSSYSLYRLFQFGSKAAGWYSLRGPISDSCELRPVNYLGLPCPKLPGLD